jgi:hypothetical protein
VLRPCCLPHDFAMQHECHRRLHHLDAYAFQKFGPKLDPPTAISIKDTRPWHTNRSKRSHTQHSPLLRLIPKLEPKLDQPTAISIIDARPPLEICYQHSHTQQPPLPIPLKQVLRQLHHLPMDPADTLLPCLPRLHLIAQVGIEMATIMRKRKMRW